MDLIDLTLRKHLSKDARSSTELQSEIQSFCEKIEENSLNLKIRDAIAFKKQGHFDKAMLNIAEANRDQVTAIRTIQGLVGQAKGERYPKVVFEKFRQFEPFEIGIADADAVLSVLSELANENDLQFQNDKLELHDTEIRRKDEEDYLSFLENRLGDGSETEDVLKTKESIVSHAQNLTELRHRILEKIFIVVAGILKDTPTGIAKDRAYLELSRNIFLVIMSPILTKPTTHVDTEK